MHVHYEQLRKYEVKEKIIILRRGLGSCGKYLVLLRCLNFFFVHGVGSTVILLLQKRGRELPKTRREILNFQA